MLKTFMDCQYAYYLRYIKRISITESSASAYGTAIHRTIKLGYENELDRDEWISLFKREWVVETASKPDLVYFSDNDYANKLKSGTKIITNYFDTFVEDVSHPDRVEFFFSKIGIGKHFVTGVFDQIDRRNRVIDYKTGTKPRVGELDYDLQFTVYSYAYRQLFGAKEKGLVLLHLPTCTEITTTRTEKDFGVLIGEIDKIEKAIKNDIFVRNLSRSCMTCYFMDKCLGKKRSYGRSKWQ